MDVDNALSIFTLLAIFWRSAWRLVRFSRRSIVLGILSVMIGTLGSTVITQPWMFLVLRALEGFGFIAIAVNIPAFITHLAAPQDRTRALGCGHLYANGHGICAADPTPFLTQIGWRGLIVMFYWQSHCCSGFVLEEPRAANLRPRAVARMVANSHRAPGLLMVGACFGVYTFNG